MKAHQLAQAVELETRRRALVTQIADVDAGKMQVTVGGTATWTGTLVNDQGLVEAIKMDVRLVLMRQLAAIEVALQDLGVEPT